MAMNSGLGNVVPAGVAGGIVFIPTFSLTADWLMVYKGRLFYRERAACAAASLAMGTRNGEQLT